MNYETEWLAWKAGKRSDGEIIARMHVDPFFKRWFEERRQALWDARDRGAGDRRAGDRRAGDRGSGRARH